MVIFHSFWYVYQRVYFSVIDTAIHRVYSKALRAFSKACRALAAWPSAAWCSSVRPLWSSLRPRRGYVHGDNPNSWDITHYH